MMSRKEFLSKFWNRYPAVKDKALDVSTNPVEDYVMAGQNHLFDMADLAGMQRLRIDDFY